MRSFFSFPTRCEMDFFPLFPPLCIQGMGEAAEERVLPLPSSFFLRMVCLPIFFPLFVMLCRPDELFAKPPPFFFSPLPYSFCLSSSDTAGIALGSPPPPLFFFFFFFPHDIPKCCRPPPPPPPLFFSNALERCNRTVFCSVVVFFPPLFFFFPLRREDVTLPSPPCWLRRFQV